MNTDLTSAAAPTLGVVIVNYNYARFLADAIQSVLHQNPPFDQIVVVDDGSTDDSRSVIAQFQPAVTPVFKSNGGALSAALAGFAAIATDYVYVLDSDDYAATGIVSLVKQHLQNDPVKLQFQLLTVNAEKQASGARFPTYADSYGSAQMIDDNRVIGFYHCPTTSANVFRRTAVTGLDAARLDPRDFIDGPVAIAMPYLGPVVSVNEVIGHYRVHGNSHSRWSHPTPALLEAEIDRFYTRWNQVCALLSFPQRPFGNDEPLYVREVRLMLAALNGSRSFAGLVGGFLRRVFLTHFALKQKLMLAVWAAAFLAPSAALRTKLVFARRSPVNRPALLQSLVGWLTGARRPAGRNAMPASTVSASTVSASTGPDSTVPSEIR